MLSGGIWPGEAGGGQGPGLQVAAHVTTEVRLPLQLGRPSHDHTPSEHNLCDL